MAFRLLATKTLSEAMLISLQEHDSVEYEIR